MTFTHEAFTHETFVGRKYGHWARSAERFPTILAASESAGRIESAERKAGWTPLNRRAIKVTP
jgi:hypothetical protein